MYNYTGSSRKNGKSKSRSRGVYFYKILIFAAVPGRKMATNYSPTPSRSLRNFLRLPSKVAPPKLAEWKSGSGSPKSRSWRALPRPPMDRESPYFGWAPILHPNYGEIPFRPQLGSLDGSKTRFGCSEALFGLPEPDFHLANVGGATFEGSRKIFRRDLDGVGE